MLSNYWRKLRAKTNSNPVLGFAPGQLLCVSTGAGGGFARAPERLTVWVRRRTVLDLSASEYEGWPSDLFPREEFPEESQDVEYCVYEEDGTFYVEKHRLKYEWTIPVTEKQKAGET